MKKRRWIYGVIGVLVLLFAGLVYAWSVLARPISEYFTGWSSTKLSFTFTLCMMFFCLGGLITGLISKNVGPKIMLKLSAVLFFVGFFLSSRSNEIITLYIGYGVIAGLAIVSQASGVAMEVGRNASAGTISTVVGLISIFNGVGRVIFGGLFDRIGRLKTMLLNNVLFFVAIFILMIAIKTNQFSLIILGFICTGLAYGGITPTNSAFVNEFYGSKHYAVNLSLVNMNLFFASFGSTVAGSLYDVSGSYFSTLIAMVVAVVFGTIFTFMIKENKVREKITYFNNIKAESSKL